MDFTIDLDKECMDDIETTKDHCIPWFILACYSKYEKQDPLVSENRLERLARICLTEWENIDHEYKCLLTKEDLNSKLFTGEYPKPMERIYKQLRTLKNGR